MKLKLTLLLMACTIMQVVSEPVSLQGHWRFAMDPHDIGIQQKWQQTVLSDSIQMPGSLQERGFGDDISTNTQWTGDIKDSTWFRAPEFAVYRQKGNVKVPFWLNPAKHYIGVAWYQHDFEIPKNEKGVIELELERVHWSSTLYVDGNEIGKQYALSTPHRFTLQDLKGGKHTLTLRIDNRMYVDVGVNAHSVTDHTQTNWNGFIGRIMLTEKPKTSIEQVIITPDIHKKDILVKTLLSGKLAAPTKIVYQVTDMEGKSFGTPISLSIEKGGQEILQPFT